MLLLIAGQEWLIVIIAVIILLIFGPGKIPALAKSIGEAIREFRRGVSGISEEPREERKQVNPKIVETARQLGISTEGKTEEQLLEEINRRLVELKQSSGQSGT